MKKTLLLKSFIIFLTLTIYSCGNSETNKTELIYENGNQKVEIQILNGNDYLEYDKPAETHFVITNIEPKTFSVSGVGIRVLGTEGGTLKTEIRVPNNYLETDTLKVKIRFGKKPEENHEFNIPIKTTK